MEIRTEKRQQVRWDERAKEREGERHFLLKALYLTAVSKNAVFKKRKSKKKERKGCGHNLSVGTRHKGTSLCGKNREKDVFDIRMLVRFYSSRGEGPVID